LRLGFSLLDIVVVFLPLTLSSSFLVSVPCFSRVYDQTSLYSGSNDRRPNCQIGNLEFSRRADVGLRLPIPNPTSNLRLAMLPKVLVVGKPKHNLPLFCPMHGRDAQCLILNSQEISYGHTMTSRNLSHRSRRSKFVPVLTCLTTARCLLRYICPSEDDDSELKGRVL
jgi:hypothetical protein